MTDFKSWRESLGLSQRDAAVALGISRSSVQLYEHGRRYDDDRPVDVPRTVRLAMERVSGKGAE